MAAEPKVLIAGCGYVGGALGERLARRQRVVGWRRRVPQRAAAFPIEACDLTRPATWGALDHERVVWCAAPGERGEQAYRATYVDALRLLLDELDRRSHPPERFVFVSSTVVLGDRGGAWVDEESPLDPSGYRAETMIEAEELVRAAPFATAIVRFAGIYGPGRTRRIELVRAGQARPRPRHWTNRIHRDDCARVLEHVLDRDELELVIGVDEAPVTELELTIGLAEMLGVDPPAAAPLEEPSGRRCRSRVLAASGFRLRFPSWRDGYAAILAADERERS